MKEGLELLDGKIISLAKATVDMQNELDLNSTELEDEVFGNTYKGIATSEIP